MLDRLGKRLRSESNLSWVEQQTDQELNNHGCTRMDTDKRPDCGQPQSRSGHQFLFSTAENAEDADMESHPRSPRHPRSNPNFGAPVRSGIARTRSWGMRTH